ncbi:drug resistance transporter, EmrB/QacA subfamily [Thermostaphylospora chromogena]|uniref:Drug resistance transporter, EmrB/QacA subfamily n=1 Tax=Thermostaphylospora chromogena TaxID=35622 RepID=A0A1H1HV26_9ACTN|nr:drug resistance transporter, EmrB/QacA subfamily [Thermostaphylospora chromogena]
MPEQQPQSPRAPREGGVARYTHRQVLKILFGLMLAILTSMLSTSVVSTALPTIVGRLGGQEHLAWVASATLLTMTASIPLWGKLSDLYGRKRMFQFSLLVFLVSSIGAGFAQDMGQLIAARAVQGIGAGGLQALPQIILGDVVEPRERGRYTGYIGGVFGVSTVAGPLLGGFLVDNASWRWCFWISVPLALVAFVVIQKVLKLPRVRGDARVDWWGATLISTGTGAVMLLLSLGGQEFPWNSGWTYGLGATGLVLFAFAVLAERRAADPILPPRLFANRTFVLASVASLFAGAAMFGALMYMPQYLQIVKGMSPTGSGLMTLPMVAAMLTSSITTGRIVTRTGRWKIFPVVGMLLVSASLFLLSLLRVDSPLPLIGVYLAFLGIGLGASMQILILSVQNAVNRRDMASATSGTTFFRSLGGAMGVAAFGAILVNRLTAELTERLRALGIPLSGGGPDLGEPEEIRSLPGPVRDAVLHSFNDALHTVFLVGVPVAVLGAVAVLALKELPLRSAGSPDRRRRGDRAEASAGPAHTTP